MTKANRSLVRDCILAITASAVSIGVLAFLLACWFLGTWWPFEKGADLPWEALGRLAIPLTALFAAIVGAVIAGHGQSAKLRELKNAEDANVTERFTSALEQLANVNENVQIGGIYALERIGHDSERDRKTIVSILRSNLLRTPSVGSTSTQVKVSKAVEAALMIAIIRLRRPDERDELESILGTDLLLEAADLSNTYAYQGSFDGMYLIQTSFRAADYREASFFKAVLYRADFSKARLERVNFRRSDLEGANFQGADLRMAQFAGASLNDSDFRNAILSRGITFQQADLTKSRFQSVDAREALFKSGTLRDSKFNRADLRGADFREADLKGVTFQGSDLRNANFEGANLAKANLVKAKVGGVKLTAEQISSLSKPLSTRQKRRIETVTVQPTASPASEPPEQVPASDGDTTLESSPQL